MTSQASLPGTPYRIIDHIGSSYRATTYRVEHAVLGTPLVLVAMRASDEGFDAGALLRLIRHPNIVEARDVGVTDETPSRPYVVFEYLNGRTLRDIMDVKTSGIGMPASIRLMGDVCRALDAAHGAGILHRAFSTKSVFLHRGAREVTIVKVLDFVIGRRRMVPRIVRELDVDDLRYLAPEQLRGEGCTVATDLHSAALVICECITGKRPFAEVDDAELMAAKLDSSAGTTALAGVVDMNPLLRDLLLASLEQEEGKRPQSAKSVLETLDEVRRQDDASTEAPRTPLPRSSS